MKKLVIEIFRVSKRDQSRCDTDLINLITSKLEQIMADVKAELLQVKEILQATNTKVDTLKTSISNIGTDVKSLLEKIAALPDISSEVTEIKGLAAQLGTNIDNTVAAANAVDNQVPPPDEQPQV